MKSIGSWNSITVSTLCLMIMGLQPASAVQPGPGDVLVVYDVHDRDSTDVDVMAQRISREGELVWAAPISISESNDIESLPVACDDGEGGAYVVFSYKFVSGEHAGDTDVVAVRIDRNGEKPWGDKTMPIASSKGLESDPVVISDGVGGIIVVFVWTNENGDSDILAQRMDGTGKLLWNGGETPVPVGASAKIERNPVAVPDGQGGVIVCFVWTDPARANGDADVMAQRISADGKEMWGEDQAIDVAARGDREDHVVAVPDGVGGVIAVFTQEYVSGEYAGDTDIMAQRVSGEGKLLWGSASDYKTVGSGTGIERHPAAASDGTGGVIVAYDYEWLDGEHKGDVDVLAQRLDASGAMQWNNGEKSQTVSTGKGLERFPTVQTDGSGGVIVGCEMERVSGEHVGDVDIVAQRLSSGGEMLWNKGDRSQSIGSSKWREERPIILPDLRGGAIFVYTALATEGEHSGDRDIEAMRIDPDGKSMWNEGKEAVDVAETDRIEEHPFALVVGTK